MKILFDLSEVESEVRPIFPYHLFDLDIVIKNLDKISSISQIMLGIT